MADLTAYRNSENETARTRDLMALLPKNRSSVLEIGALDGHFSRLLAEHFETVTALDLEKPPFEIPGVDTVAGDVTKLAFPDESFDCVFCTEVLEHVPALEQACREIVRVVKHEIVLGVPYKQDIRLGRATCQACGKINPPWGHVNSFDEDRLAKLFPGLRAVGKSFIGVSKEATNPIATFLMDAGGNPWGTYDHPNPCIHCGVILKVSQNRTALQQIASSIAVRLNYVQALFTKPHGNWIHLVLSKDL